MAEFLKADEEAEREETIEPSVAAIAIALDHAKIPDPPSANAVEEFLASQRELIADQRHHLAAQYKTLALDRWSKRLKLTLQALTLLVGVLAFGFVGNLVWQAHSADGVVIEPFGVPPDMAAKGYTGQALAARVQDRLKALQAETKNARAAASYATDWGHEITVEIPETGISLGELSKILRQSLGHERHVGGDLVHTPTGLALTVRGDEGGEDVKGDEADMDGLVRRAAEALYRRTQPYRYGAYLAENGRYDEARAVFTELAERGPPSEQPWGLAGLARWEPDPVKSREFARRALAINPDMAIAWDAEWSASVGIGDYEEATRAGPKYIELLGRPDHGGWSPDAQLALLNGASVRTYFGDFSGCLSEAQEAAKAATKASVRDSAERTANFCLGLTHDVAGLHRRNHAVSDGETMRRFGFGQNEWNTVWTTNDWAYGLEQLRAETQAALEQPDPDSRNYARERLLPQQAMMLAKLGRVEDARSALTGIDANGYWARKAAAYIAGASGDHRTEDALFDRLIGDTPHVAWTYSEWGSSLRDRRDYGALLALMDRALKVAPRYGDIHELRGEALLGLERPQEALRSFDQANSFVPKWGRIHLKWGEALARAGRRNEAKVQFDTAASLDLSPSERTELAHPL